MRPLLRRVSGTAPSAAGLPTDSPSGCVRRGRPEPSGCHPLSGPLGVRPSLRGAGILALGTSGRSRAASPRSQDSDPRQPQLQRAVASRRFREGPSARCPSPGPRARSQRLRPPRGEKKGCFFFFFLATLRLCDLTLQFLKGRSQGWGEAGAGFPRLLSNMTLSLILNFRSPSPSLGLRSGRGLDNGDNGGGHSGGRRPVSRMDQELR